MILFCSPRKAIWLMILRMALRPDIRSSAPSLYGIRSSDDVYLHPFNGEHNNGTYIWSRRTGSKARA